jgi:filamentous hemagglutinin family protein
MVRRRNRQAKNILLDNSVFIAGIVSLALSVQILPAFSQQIIVDGKTNTTLKVNDSLTTVNTKTIKGQNAFNSFQKFNVDKGNTVNLVVPSKANNLINLIHSEKTNINGILNSIKGGKIGGNIYLVNPYGITVGSQGVINVGSLTAITPSHSYMNNFFNSSGNPDNQAVINLLNNNVPVNQNASIINYGTIRAINNVKLDTGSIINTGKISANSFNQSQSSLNNVDISDIINTEELERAEMALYEGGNITLASKANFVNKGTIEADSLNKKAGNIKITSDADITMTETSKITAMGHGKQADGGYIYIYGKNTYLNKGALVDASAGKISGDGGFAEVSAEDTVLTKGTINAKAFNGKPGEILIDPFNLVINGGRFSDGSNLTFQALNNILVKEGTTISSRNLNNVYTEDHSTAPSQGDSGNIKFESLSLDIEPNTRIYSFANNNYKSGDIIFRANNLFIDTSGVKPEIIAGSGNAIINRAFIGNINIKSSNNNPGKSRNKFFNGFLHAMLTDLNLYDYELDTINAENIIIGCNSKIFFATNKLNVNANLNIPGNLTLNAVNLISVNGNIGINNNLSVNTFNKTNISGNLNIGNDLIVNSAKNLNIEAAGNNSNTNIMAKGNIILSSEAKNGSILLGTGNNSNKKSVNVTADGNIVLSADGHTFISGKNTDVHASNLVLSSDKKNAGITQNASVTVDKNVTIEAQKGNVFIDGSITAGNDRSQYLMVRNNGSIDPSSNLIPEIANGQIYINKDTIIGGEGGTITISGKKVQGKGSLSVTGGNGNVNIINNSSHNLNIDTLQVAEGTPGSITINNKPVTSRYDKISVNINNNEGPEGINITNNSSSDVLLSGLLSSTKGDVLINNNSGNILNAAGTDEQIIQAKHIALNASGIGQSPSQTVNIDTINGGNLTAISSQSDIYVSELSGDLYVNSVQAKGNVYLSSAGSILDGNTVSEEAKISGNALTLIAGETGNIGNNTPEGILEIETTDKLTAMAEGGSIYLKETGPEPTVIVDTLKAKDNIYLHADWKIQNFEGSSITTTANNSKITLITDDTKLFDDATNTGGTIQTGSDGYVSIERTTPGDIHASYQGDDNLYHPSSGETTFVTTRELSTISTGFVEIIAHQGQEIWGDTQDLNIIIDDDYDFLSNPVNVENGIIHILRKTDGILTLGGTIDDIGVITQNEINNITADDILLGNVLDPSIWEYGNTIEIRLLSPDFSTTSSTSGASNVTLITSGNIIDANPSSTTPLLAKNLNLVAGAAGSGSIGGPGTQTIDIQLVEDGSLSATATDDINVTHYNSDMLLDKVHSETGNVQLTSMQGILDANGDDVNVIAAKDITLTAYPLSNIGTETDFIEINSATSGTGSVSAQGSNIYLNEIEGDLNINQIANGRYFANYVYLKASDSNGASILDYDISSDSTYNIRAYTTSLEAKYGSIGSGGIGDNGDIDIQAYDLAVLEKIEAGTAEGFTDPVTINIQHNGGSSARALRIGEIISNEYSTVNISTNGEIIDSELTDNPDVDITANIINLSSARGIGYGYVRENNTYVNSMIDIKLIGENPLLNTTFLDILRLTSDGDMHLGNLTSTTTSSTSSMLLISRNGSILDGLKTGEANIQAPWTTPLVHIEAIESTSGYGGYIGSQENPVVLNITSGSNDYVKTVSNNDTFLKNINTSGQLQIMTSTSGGNYSLESDNTVSLIRNPNSTPAILSAGDIYIKTNSLVSDYITPSYNEEVLIEGHNINIVANDSIGAPLVGDIDIICYGSLSATSAGNIYFDSPLDIQVDSIIANGVVSITSGESITLGEITTSGDVNLLATGSVTAISDPGVINISSADIVITAGETIGTELQPIEVLSSTGIVTADAPEVYVNEN